MAKPKMAMIPSTVGGSVYSVLPSNGDGDFDFTRASAATRINAQGLIETVAVGDNRLNYPLLDGRVQTCPHLLLEPQRTNLIPYSSDYSTWSTQNTTIIENEIISPDGTLNATRITASTISQPRLEKTLSVPLVDTKYTFSVFIKKGNTPFVALSRFSGGQAAIFNLDTKSVVSSSTEDAVITEVSNGWFRISITQTVLSSYASNIWKINVTNGINYAVGVVGDYFYAYGAQVEEGSYPTSYIVSNSGSATTRLAEVCDGSGNASTFNDSEGVLMAQIGALADDGTNRVICINDGTSLNRVQLYFNTSNQIVGGLSAGGSGQANITYTVDIKSFLKVAFKYKVNNFTLWVNGFEVGEDLIGNAPTGLNVINFDNTGGTLPFYGKTKQIQYFDSALTDSELETLTSWMSFSDMAIDLNYTIQ